MLKLPLIDSIAYVGSFLFFSFCVFFWGRKGDYYRYLAEFKGADERKEAADQSLKAYEVVFVTIFFSQSFFYSLFFVTLTF